MEHIDLALVMMDMASEPLRRMQKEAERTGRMYQRLGKETQAIGRGISSIGETMLPVAAGITALGVAGGNAFIDFDAIITGAAAKAGATAEEMELMRQKASQFGADFPISATQAAEGMDRLAAAGYDANQVIGVMPSVITAAVASGEDLAVTSDVVSNALNIWNLKQGDIATNAAHVADVVQMAANKSSLGMQDFGLAMQYAGAPAAKLGVQIEDLSAAMAIVKNNGIEASTIGTSLRSMFSRLSAPPKEAAEAIAQLGLQTKDAKGNFIGLKPVIDQMRQSMQNLSNTQQVALAKSIAGEDGFSALLSLISTSPEEYQAMTDAMYNATGSSQAQFEVMKNTVKNAIDGMIGSFESLAINMGDALKPQIIAVSTVIGNLADFINQLSPEAKKLVGDIMIGTVAFTGMTLAVGKMVSIGGSTIRTIGDIKVAAQGGSIANKALEESVFAVSSRYKELRSQVKAYLEAQGGTKGITTNLKAQMNSVKNMKWADVGSGIANMIPNFSLAGIKKSISTTLKNISKDAIEAGNSVLRMAKQFSIANTTNTLSTGLSEVGRGIFAVTKASFSTTLKNISKNAIEAGNSVLRMARQFSIANTINTLSTGLSKVGRGILAVTKASFAFAISPLSIVLIAIAGAAYLVYKNWNTVGPFFINLWNKITTAVSSAVQKIQPTLNILKNNFNILVNALKPAFNTIHSLFVVISSGTGVFAPLLDIIKLIAVVLGGAFLGAIIIAANVITGTLIAAVNIAAGVINMLLGVFNGIIVFLTGVFTGDWSMAWNGIVQIFSSIFSGIVDICDGVLAGVKASINGVIDSINSINVDIPEWVPGVGGKHFGPLGIPHLYTGTNNWSGGVAMIHDRGAEIVDLPSGTRVIPHDKSLKTAYAQGVKSGEQGATQFNINIYGANIRNDKEVDDFAREVMQRCYYEFRKRSINMNEGAI